MKTRLVHPEVLFEMLTTAFIATLVLSNILSIKPIQFGVVVFDAGTILFPLAYIIGDIVTEVYGLRRLRRLLVIGCGVLIVMSVLFWLVGVLPGADYWQYQTSYDEILGVAWRIAVASLIAIFVGEMMNAYVLVKMKAQSKGKNLWARLIGSSAVGSLIDTVLFSVLAFAGTMPSDVLLQLIVTVYVIKMSVEIVVSPITMSVIRWIKRNTPEVSNAQSENS